MKPYETLKNIIALEYGTKHALSIKEIRRQSLLAWAKKFSPDVKCC